MFAKLCVSTAGDSGSTAYLRSILSSLDILNCKTVNCKHMQDFRKVGYRMSKRS